MSNYHNNNGPFTVAQLAKKIGREFLGDGDKQIVSINAIQEAQDDQLAFLDNPKYAKYLETTKAGVVVVRPDLAENLPEGVAAILSPMPHPDYAKISNIFYADEPTVGFIHDNAFVDSTATVGHGTIVEAGAVISEGVKIGPNCRIGANAHLAKNVTIGENTIIKSNVAIECTSIGTNCLIHSGAKIGQDGFGFAFDPENTVLIKVPQVGAVKIGHYVEIGANTTIDRGSLLDTEIGDMTKIDNLVQIGHNVKIGRLCQIVAQTGIAGSTTIGDGCIFGGQSGVAGHLTVADRVVLASKGGISKNVTKVGEMLGGFPAVPIQQWRKGHAVVARLIKNKGK